MFKNKDKGFALIEVIVATAVFVLFALGIYSSIQFVFKVVYQSRLRIIETGVLNEQVEIIRNLGYHDVGIVDGSPSGVLARVVTTTRNGIDFTITRTVRNIDDQFDGVIGGEPNDIAPADYKLVDVEIICDSCGQREPLRMVTYVAPKLLEGDPTHGALFIEVFDADGLPVQGANVHVVATSTDPTINLIDTTDNDGMLRLVDLAEGISAYQIIVSKDGYTTDQTLLPTEENPHPTKGYASVAAQDVTEISFSIDKVASIELSTIDELCDSMSGTAVDMIGTKLIGTEPDVYILEESVSTDSYGAYSWPALVWDTYSLNVPNYDLLGTIPLLPINLLPAANQPVQLIVGSNTSHSLLVHVSDGVTMLPISNATVHITATGFDSSKQTGVGHKNQTDWSGGTGQLLFTDMTKYWADDGKTEVSDSPGNVTLRLVGENYVTDGELESSVFDLGISANYVNLVWEPMAQPAETGENSVRWQIATSNATSTETWEYLGPDGTTATYYNEENTVISAVHNSNRYFRYKLYLTTASTTYTPTVSSISVSYTNSCTPPGQTYFGGLSNQEYNIEVTASGYSIYNGTATAEGNTLVETKLTSG